MAMINRRLAIVNPLVPPKQVKPTDLSPVNKPQPIHSSHGGPTSCEKATNWSGLPSPIGTTCHRCPNCSKFDSISSPDYNVTVNQNRFPSYVCSSLHTSSNSVNGSTSRQGGTAPQTKCPWSHAVTLTREDQTLRTAFPPGQSFASPIIPRNAHSCCHKCLSPGQPYMGSQAHLAEQPSSVKFHVSPPMQTLPPPQLSPGSNSAKASSNFRLAKAVADSCDPSGSEMLSFSKGDVIVILGVCDTSDTNQETVYRGYLLSQGPQLAGLIPSSKIILEHPPTVLDPVKFKVDFAVQTEADSDVTEEYSSETDCSDCSDAETSSVTCQNKGNEHDRLMQPNRLHFSSKPQTTKAPEKRRILDSLTTSPQHSMRSVHSGSCLQSVPPLTPISNVHTTFHGESTKRNSATSLDSGRDSTYAGSSEGSNGLNTSMDKTPVSVKTSPNRTCFGYQQSCMTHSTQFPGSLMYAPDTDTVGFPDKSQTLIKPTELQIEKSRFDSINNPPLSFTSATPNFPASVSSPVSNYLPTSCPNYLYKHPEESRTFPLTSSAAVTCSAYQLPQTSIANTSQYGSATALNRPRHQHPSGCGSNNRTPPHKSAYTHPLGMHYYSRVACERQQLSGWLYSIGLSRLEENLITSGFCLWTLCRATPEELNACGVTNPYDRQILRTELNRLHMVDPIPDQLPHRVQDWLSQLDLDVYWPCLYNHGYTTFDRLVKLTWEDLEEIGVIKLGHQKKILLAIAKVKRLIRATSHSPPRSSLEPSTKICQKAFVSPNIHSTQLDNLLDCTVTIADDRMDTFGARAMSSSTTHAFSTMVGTPTSVEDLSDSPPLPAPPPAFQDSVPEQVNLDSPTLFDSSKLPGPSGLEDRLLTCLPPPIPLRRSSIVQQVNESVGDSFTSRNDPLRSAKLQRRSYSVLGREKTGSEPDLLSCFSRRSSSPSFLSMTSEPLGTQMTKCSSGQLLTEPQLRLPLDYQPNMDPELQDMQNLRAMLDELSEHLTIATQL